MVTTAEAASVNLSFMNVVPPSGNVRDELLKSIARARGCQTEDEIAQFLDPLPRLENPIMGLRDLPKALARIRTAIAKEEVITIFGDYDCDGVTSCTQWINLFRAVGHKNFRVYIPNRFIEDYGLTMDAIDTCLAEQKPSLIISVDCGSVAIEALKTLRARGVDTIVIDHHDIHHQEDEHPSFAHLNPKGDPGFASSPVLQDAGRMSAAGLCFFVCSALAKEAGIAWDHRANLIIAGLGTLVDVMPLVGTNRALVKHSLALANSPELEKVPGLVALLKANSFGSARITSHTYGFIIGPCINANGRLTHAKNSVNLMCSRGPKAEQFALELVESNNQRKKIQNGIVTEAMTQAKSILSATPDAKILVLYSKDWHTGIVGIVAGKVRESTGVPTIVIARLENGFWKGSGRSVRSFDIGRFAKMAVDAGVITSGGGHGMACGVKLTDDQISRFVKWAHEESMRIGADLTPTIEVLAESDWLPAHEWEELLDQAGPFGNGNQQPCIEFSEAAVLTGPDPIRRNSDQVVFALEATIQTKGAGRAKVQWNDIERARGVLSPEQRINLYCEFDRRTSNGKVYRNWKVVHGEATV